MFFNIIASVFHRQPKRVVVEQPDEYHHCPCGGCVLQKSINITQHCNTKMHLVWEGKEDQYKPQRNKGATTNQTQWWHTTYDNIGRYGLRS